MIATNILTPKSPNAKVNHGILVPWKEIEKNKKVSTVDPIIEEVNGAINHFFLLRLSNIWTSISWAVKKAAPDPIAILIEIKSAKSVENKTVKPIPSRKPR